MSQWTTSDIPNLTGKRALVTGANSGLGQATARVLAEKGAHVLLACRDLQKGQATLAAIQADLPSSSVELMQLDLASLASVQALAERVLQSEERLDLLFNNAGVMAIPRRETADGFEMQFGVNYLGHFALTGLLLPLLLATPASRVVHTTSAARAMGAVRLDDLQRQRSYRRWEAYGQSKRANLLFAFELQTRLAAVGVGTISVAAHPGYANTNLQQTSVLATGSWFERNLYAIGKRVLGQTPLMGALPQLYAATSSDIVGGELVGPGSLGGLRGYPQIDRRAQKEYDYALAARLWDESVRLTSVQYNEIQPVASNRAGV